MRRRNLLTVGGGASVEGCLEFEVLSEPAAFKFSGTSSNTLQYSINGNAWQDLANNTYTSTLNQGDKIYFKGTCTPTSNGIGKFVSSGGTWNAKGTPMSLLFGDDFSGQTSLSGKNYAFRNLFSGCAKLQSAENLSLPATTLTKYCYTYMFGGCTSLTTAPSLPATTLISSCYYQMFQGCSKLTTAPSLPATTLATLCYYNMFFGCTSLTTAPTLPATTLKGSCYHSMFYATNVLPDCTNINFSSPTVVASGGLRGLFSGTKLTDSQLDTILKSHGINNYSLPCTTLASECYSSMFNGCTSLTTAPSLPATTLADSCYYEMFYATNVLPDCTNINFSSPTVVASGGLKGLFCGTKLTDSQLNTILRNHGIYNYSLPCTTLASSCYSHMFERCSSLTTAPTLPATTLAENCYFSMFNDCTSLTTAPSLPAPTLTDWCYYGMFANCSNLSSITCLATNISASYCTNYWVNGVAASGTFTKASSMSSWTRGDSGIPTNWTVYNA